VYADDIITITSDSMVKQECSPTKKIKNKITQKRNITLESVTPVNVNINLDNQMFAKKNVTK